MLHQLQIQAGCEKAGARGDDQVSDGFVAEPQS
jgi:hypothetical protein